MLFIIALAAIVFFLLEFDLRILAGQKYLHTSPIQLLVLFNRKTLELNGLAAIITILVR